MNKRKTESKNEIYYKAVEDFYKQKNKYDNKLKAKKKSIKKLPTVEKKAAIETWKKQRKCIKCKKNGGTIFEEKMRTLKAVCGHETPCNLHIEIEKPIHQFIPEQRKIIDEYIEGIKTDISIIKLDLLFDLIDDTVSINEFETLKKELETEMEFKNILTTAYHDINNVVEIPSEGGGMEDVLLKDYLNDLQQSYNQHVSVLKRRISEYKENNSASLLEDTINDYSNIIIPLQDKIREMKYQITYINPDPSKWKQNTKTPMPEFHFIPTKIDIQNQIVDTTDFKIIAYSTRPKKKKKKKSNS